MSAGPETYSFARRAVVLACRKAIWLESCRIRYSNGRPCAYGLVAKCAAELRTDIALDFMLKMQQAVLQTEAAAQALWEGFWRRWDALRSSLRVTENGTRLAFADLVGARWCTSVLRGLAPSTGAASSTT